MRVWGEEHHCDELHQDGLHNDETIASNRDCASYIIFNACQVGGARSVGALISSLTVAAVNIPLAPPIWSQATHYFLAR
jgi:hypothetical protein